MHQKRDTPCRPSFKYSLHCLSFQCLEKRCSGVPYEKDITFGGLVNGQCAVHPYVHYFAALICNSKMYADSLLIDPALRLATFAAVSALRGGAIRPIDGTQEPIVKIRSPGDVGMMSIRSNIVERCRLGIQERYRHRQVRTRTLARPPKTVRLQDKMAEVGAPPA